MDNKRLLAATGILVWAGALQYHMWSLTGSEEYKRSALARAGDDARSVSVSFGGLFGGSDGEGEGGSGKEDGN